MNVKIGNLTFDHATYDADGDVLYLHVGERQAAANSEETPEGHALRFGADGSVISLTIINARRLLDRDGEIAVTLPEQVHVSPTTLEPVLASAA
ncbi:MAG: DUF2283 domain-containing protein [Solirubrobacterales bacterium]|nr:DUF2283 domain-containing protein [Solirubrobacterales bacterium]